MGANLSGFQGDFGGYRGVQRRMDVRAQGQQGEKVELSPPRHRVPMEQP